MIEHDEYSGPIGHHTEWVYLLSYTASLVTVLIATVTQIGVAQGSRGKHMHVERGGG